ncbi:MAG TPA: hypothetical protein VH393_04360 [Ktedonobacterales bacterium]|jgi:hypothetical protein
MPPLDTAQPDLLREDLLGDVALPWQLPRVEAAGWTGHPCVTISTVVPTRYNPAPGQRLGSLIPQWHIDRVKGEFFTLVRSGRVERAAQLIHAPVLVSAADGVWVDAETADSPRAYTDPDALRLTTNVDLSRALHVWHAIIHRAADWADELEQLAWYVELHGRGEDRHQLVPCRSSNT